jgi:TDG/mug DNA glycosylase family protein
VGFTNAELETYYGGSLPDLVGPDTRLLLVGINPGLLTAAVQAHFARRGNRFYPALYRAGIVDRIIDASAGFEDADRAHLLNRGVGITSLVPAATRRADELSLGDLREGAVSLTQRVAEYRPTVVAMLGITAYRVAFERKSAVIGRQPDRLAGAELWVVPNPSGLNAHSSLADLAHAYREVAVAAGIPVYSPPFP